MPDHSAVELENYRAYVRQRLARLNKIFADASVGIFSNRLAIPDQDDEFTELYAGIGIMLDVIREKISDAELLNTELVQQIKQLERMNRLMVGRELKMRELKKEVADLRSQLGLPAAERHE